LYRALRARKAGPRFMLCIKFCIRKTPHMIDIPTNSFWSLRDGRGKSRGRGRFFKDPGGLKQHMVQ
jgi:hypothetical protein